MPLRLLGDNGSNLTKAAAAREALAGMAAPIPSFALVTGASSGLGTAFARALPAERPLLLTGRDAARLEALAGELGQDGRPVEWLAANLASEAGRQAVIAAAAARPLGLLINNAGLGTLGRLDRNDAEREAEMVQVNCVAPVVLTRALLPALLAEAGTSGRRSGLILVASTAACAPLPYFATYAATKAFDRFLGEALAEELREEPLDVLTLSPGPTTTDFFRRAGLPSFRRIATPAAAVAEQALAALGRRRHLVVGLQNRIYAGGIGLVPGPLRRWGIRRYLRRLDERQRP